MTISMYVKLNLRTAFEFFFFKIVAKVNGESGRYFDGI